MNEDQPCQTEPCEGRTLVSDNIDPFKHGILIEQLHYGFKVKVGCQSFAIESVDKLIKNIEAYLKNPLETQNRWNKDKSLL